MVSTSQAVRPPLRHPQFGWILAILRNIADFFASIDRAVKAAHEYDRLRLLSDQQLSELGLSRQTLVEHIFAKYLTR